MNVVRKNIKHW